METNDKPQINNTTRRALLILNCILLTVGNCGGPLILRLYFIHGGKRVWFSSWLQTGGWPIIFILLLISYFHRCSHKPTTKFFYMDISLFIAATIVGVITGFDDYLYAYGIARLPVSTSSLIIATQLGFTAGFAFLLVKQKFNFYSINAVILLTVGAGVLALHSSSDRPEHESKGEYILGFVMTLAAAAIYGLILPLVELIYKKSKQEISYTLVMEIQLVMSLFATVVCTVGMLVNEDFEAIPGEARGFGLGETKYYVIIVCTAIILQCFFLGAIGVIFYSSSLVSAIIIAVLLPVTEILAVIFYQEKFQAEKGVALALSLWGFISYFYGEAKQTKKENLATETEMSQSSNPTHGII